MAGPGLPSTTTHGVSTVRVSERGHSSLSRDEWRSLSSEQGFWRLVQRDVIGVSFNGNRIQLDGNCYIGRAQLGDITLEIDEKVPGAAATLLDFATYTSFRQEPLKSPATELGDLVVIIVRAFLTALRRYVSRGREAHYVAVREQGPTMAGRLDLTQTLALRARGLRHVMAFHRTVLLRNTLKNRVLYAALREVDKIASRVGLPQSDIATVRALSLMFEDCVDSEVLFRGRERFVGYTEVLLADSRHVADRDLISLAGVILAHLSFEYDAPIPGRVPLTWFLNLETLFQTAVLRLLGALTRGSATVTSGRGDHRVFPAVDTEYKARPDYVVRYTNGSSVVGDAKYKEWTGAAAHHDVYQLMAHASAFQAKLAFLVYPGESFEVRDLGESASGIRVLLFVLQIADLSSSVKRVLGALDEPKS